MKTFKTILITGIAGSGGSYLAEYIAEHHPEVELHGISRWHSTSSPANLGKVKNKAVIHECDLNDASSLFFIIKKVMPDAIFHLAAHANVRASFDNPQAVLDNNIKSTLNLFEVARMNDIRPVIQLASTSEVYGQVDPKDVPIKESCPLRPANPYAVSKLAQDALGDIYYKSYGLPIIRTRMFTYINPRRADLFATSFAYQVARIEKGLQKELLHGNLHSTRTILDVRDAVEAYWLAVTKGEPGEIYNIGGTTVVTVGEFLEKLKQSARCPIPSRVDPALLRPLDVTLQIPDTTKFVTATGWKPKYTFEESIDFLLEYARKAI